MTLLPIATQTPMFEFFGVEGCYFYTVSQVTSGSVLVVGGFGMVVYRLLCLQKTMMTKEERKATMKRILIAEVLIVLVLVFSIILGVVHVGWERAIFYRYCRGIDSLQGEILAAYTGNISGKEFTALDKILRSTPIILAQGLIIGEVLIYAKIIRDLWRKDQEFVKKKIISFDQKQERNQKNLITLKGQIYSFVMEMIMSTTMVVFLTIYPEMSPSLMPVLWTVGGSLISVPHLLSSHELKRFLKGLISN